MWLWYKEIICTYNWKMLGFHILQQPYSKGYAHCLLGLGENNSHDDYCYPHRKFFSQGSVSSFMRVQSVTIQEFERPGNSDTWGWGDRGLTKTQLLYGKKDGETGIKGRGGGEDALRCWSHAVLLTLGVIHGAPCPLSEVGSNKQRTFGIPVHEKTQANCSALLIQLL